MSFERTVPHLQDMDAADAVEFDIRKSTGRQKKKESQLPRLLCSDHYLQG